MAERLEGLGVMGLGWQGSGCRDESLEVHRKYNLLSNCSYNPIISRVTIIMGLIFRL